MRNILPHECYSTVPSTGELIILKRGKKGYFQTAEDTGDKLQNQKIAEFNNHIRGISPAQVMAMEVGSMCGFDVPGADPQLYFDEAKLVSTHPLGLSAVLYADDSLHENEAGCVYEYQVAGKTCFYLEPASIPESMMGVDCDTILWPDMVHGKPLIPVSLKWQENGGCEMTLERGALTYTKEVNANYQITAKIHVGPVQYALGELDGKFPAFVTWERTPTNDRGGDRNYYWGHYYGSRKDAIKDLCTRASEKYEMLAEYRKPSIRNRLAVAKAAQAETPAAQQCQKDKGAR